MPIHNFRLHPPLLALFTAPILRRVAAKLDEEQGEGLPEKFRWVVNVPPSAKGGKLLGILETIFFFASLAMGSPELLAAWLVFKLGSKWEAFQNIIKVNMKAGEEDVMPLKARHLSGTNVLQRLPTITADP